MEVFFPAERLMGSDEGLESGVTTRGPKEETFQHYLRNDDASNERGLGNRSSQYLTLDRGAKFEVQKAGRLLKCNDGITKRLGMVTTEFSKTKAGLLDVNRLCPESASSPASYKFSEKTLPINKGTVTGRRGHKRNTKPQKNRGDSFSLKNGLVGFHAASGGNDYLGMYGLKHDPFDVAKHIKVLPLDLLLSGSYKFSNITAEKAKEAAVSSVNLLETHRKVCQVLEDKKVLQAQKCVDIDDSCIANDPTSLVASSSSIGLTDSENGNSCILDLPSSDKVTEPIEKLATNVAELPLYQPKDILQRLSLSPQKDLDLLLSDAGKTSSSRHSTDPHSGKPGSQRNGLPPLPWSNSSSGNNKLAADAAKMSLNRTICHGKWIKMENSIALQKSSDDFLVGFESLIFNQSLVPSLTVVSTQPEIEVASADMVLPASDKYSDVLSPAHVAAQTLVDMAKCSKQTPHETVKLLKKPLQTAMRSSKSRLAPERSIKFIDPPRSTKLINPLKNPGNALPSKKLKLSASIRDGITNHIEPARKGPFHCSVSSSSSSPVRSPGKLGRDSTTSGRDSYGTESFKKPSLMKPPRSAEPPRPSSMPSKFRNSLQ